MIKAKCTYQNHTVILKDAMKGEYSRQKASQVKESLFGLLAHGYIVDIDLKDSIFPPGVADELIGGLAVRLGAAGFKNLINIINASESQMTLMKHVIARRMSEKSNVT